MKPVLVLRPEPGASATAEAARSMGLSPVVAPLFDVVPVAWDPPPPVDHDALMLTSANAVRHAGPALAAYATLPCYAVGDMTAAVARTAGLRVVVVGPGDAAALLVLLASDGRLHPLHLAGKEHHAVARPGMTITRRIVYAARAVSALPAEVAASLACGAVALLHSPRAAALLASLVPDRQTLAIAAMSEAVAAAAGPGWSSTAIAACPTDRALLAAAAPLCEDRLLT